MISPTTAQRLQGYTFLGMGLATMLLPGTLIPLSFNADFLAKSGGHTPALDLTFRCFGAQATLCGVLLLTCEFTRTTWQAWIAAIAPFFVFDALALYKGVCTPLGFLGDLAGNVVFTACGVAGLMGTAAAARR